MVKSYLMLAVLNLMDMNEYQDSSEVSAFAEMKLWLTP